LVNPALNPGDSAIVHAFVLIAAEGRTMTGPEHYRLAEGLLTSRGVLDDVLIGTTIIS
jgi:hypothetical protein